MLRKNKLLAENAQWVLLVGLAGVVEAVVKLHGGGNKKPRLITAGATTKKLSYENKNFLYRICFELQL